MMGAEPPQVFDPMLSTELMESLPLSSSSSTSSSEYRSGLTADTSVFPSSLVEPASYANTLFRPFDSLNSINLPSGSSRTSTSGNFEITVSSPQKENDAATSLVPGSGSFFTYLITTRTSMASTEFTVRRRFSDVVSLADRLAKSHRGFFIPLRPDKGVIDSQVMQTREFVEHRRAALEKYLQRLAAHPVIGRSEELLVFLREPGKLPIAPTTTDLASRMLDGALLLPKQLFGDGSKTDAGLPARGVWGLLRMFKELKQSVRNDFVGTKPFVVEDKAFLETKERIQEFTLRLNASSGRAEALVKAQHDIGETMGKLGLSLVELVKLEKNKAIFELESSLSISVKLFATAAVKTSRFYRELNSQTIKYLETLYEYVGLMLSIQNAFSERSNTLLTVQTLLSDLASWNARAENLEVASARIFGGKESRIYRFEEIKRTIRVIEDAKSCAVKEHEKVKENNRYELERFEKEKHNDFLNMLSGLAISQVEYFEKMADVWERVASETSHFAEDSCRKAE